MVTDGKNNSASLVFSLYEYLKFHLELSVILAILRSDFKSASLKTSRMKFLDVQKI